MKKLFFTISLAAAVAFANAQDMTSKKGVPILPETGDWSIGISVNPFFEYFGNLMNGTANNSSPTWDFNNSNQIITGKLVKDETTSYRAKLRLGFGSTSSETGDTTSGNLSKTETSAMNINLGAGLQKNRGKGRLRGIYGGELGFGIGSGSTTNSYNGTPAPTALTKNEQGGTFNLSIRGFIGAEFFFAPKMSISGEFGWGLGLSSTGEGTLTYGDGSSSKVGASSTFGIDTDNTGGSIDLNFYF